MNILLVFKKREGEETNSYQVIGDTMLNSFIVEQKDDLYGKKELEWRMYSTEELHALRDEVVESGEQEFEDYKDTGALQHEEEMKQANPKKEDESED